MRNKALKKIVWRVPMGLVLASGWACSSNPSAESTSPVSTIDGSSTSSPSTVSSDPGRDAGPTATPPNADAGANGTSDASPPGSDDAGGLDLDAAGGGDESAARGGNGDGSSNGAETGAPQGDGGVVVSTATDGKETINGPYNAPPEATRMPGVPQAKLDTFTFNTSKVFPNTSREVDIFIPAQYVAGTEVPFMVIQDGVEQLTAYHTNIVLENLIYQKRLPVMAAIFVNRPDNGPERSREYDCIDDAYSEFIATEILPLVKTRHPELNLTNDPNGRGSLGKSSGGPAAFTLGWRHDDRYHRILTLNGSFVPLCTSGPGANTYPATIRMTDPAKPLRVYMFSGTNDNAGFAAGNQAMADALMAKGYAWRYVYGIGASHANNYAASMIVEALLWTWAGYPL